MAALPPVRRVDRPPDAPSWLERLLDQINLFMDSVYLALARNLTFQENIRSNIRELTFTTSGGYDTGTFTPLRFATGLGVKAIGLLVLQLFETSDADEPILEPVVANWNEVNGEIRVKYISGLANSTRYTARFLVF